MSVVIYANESLATLWQSQLTTPTTIITDNKELEFYIQNNKVEFVFIQSSFTYEIQMILSQNQTIKVVALSNNLTTKECLSLFKLGIFAYISIYSSDNIINYTLTSKNKIIPPNMMSKLISLFLSSPNSGIKQNVLDTLLGMDRLSNSQKIILFLMSNLKTDEEIYSILNMELSEYYKNIKSILSLFDTKNRVDFVKYISGENRWK